MTLDSDVARLARIRPFNLMPREAVQLIAFSSEKRRMSTGDALFHVGETGDAGFFVHTGTIGLLEKGVTPESARRIGAGALIGESALYATVVRRVEPVDQKAGALSQRGADLARSLGELGQDAADDLARDPSDQGVLEH